MVFRLRWKRYGGSGTNLTHTEIMGFEYGRILEEYEMLRDEWDAESQALKGRGGGHEI